jgi:cytochrome c oxidase subunit 4
MNHHIAPIRTNIQIFVILLVLLFATVGAAYLPLGDFHFATAMAIAAAKALIIAWFFMHLRHSHRLAKIIFAASFLWLAIMIVMTMADYTTRAPYGWLDIPGK